MTLELDQAKMFLSYRAASYKIEYGLYFEEGDEIKELTLKTLPKESVVNSKDGLSTACFSAFRRAYLKFFNQYSMHPNRILYECVFNYHNKEAARTTEEERVWWVRRCKDIGLMPEYIGDYFLKTGNYILDISKMNANCMYANLTASRFLHEEPYFVKCVYYLCEEKKIDFLAALIMASRACISNTGHHLFPIGSYPGMSSPDELLKVGHLGFGYAMGLRKFLLSKEQKVIQKEFEENKDRAAFTCGAFSLHISLRKFVPASKLESWKVEDYNSKKLLEFLYEN